MTDSKDYREFLKSEFTHIRKELEFIREQVTKTNGRVNKHDDLITEALIERAKNRQEQKQLIPDHVINCPHIEIINDLNEWREQQIAKENEVIHQESVKTRNWTKVIGMAGIIITFLGLLLAIARFKHDVDRKFENLGTPYISVPRGEELPEGATIKMWPNDFNDTIK